MFMELRIRFEGYLVSIILVILRNSHVLGCGLVFIVFLVVLVVVLLLDLVAFGVGILLLWLFHLINDIGTWSVRSLTLIPLYCVCVWAYRTSCDLEWLPCRQYSLIIIVISTWSLQISLRVVYILARLWLNEIITMIIETTIAWLIRLIRLKALSTPFILISNSYLRSIYVFSWLFSELI